MSFYFVVDSDPQIGKEGQELAKSGHTSRILSLSKELSIKCMIMPGDLTDLGSDGKCCSSVDQLGEFINEWVSPLETIKGMQLLLCAGNHDTYTFNKPVMSWLKKRHGDHKYFVDIHNIRFICLGIYPDKKNCEWLKSQININNPIVLFFHYNLSGPYSDWWKDTEKEEFFNVINGHNIIGIFTGHIHDSFMTKWKGFNVYSTGGKYFALCRIKDNVLTAEFCNNIDTHPSKHFFRTY